MTLEADLLRRMWPRAPQALIDGVVRRAPYVFDKYGLTTPLRQAHFLAQISHESDGGRITAEDLDHYTALRITQVWPTRFRTVAEAEPYAHNGRALASKVYNGRMGNEPGTDDGYVYRGRGLLQITGRASYREIGALDGLPLEAQPELAAAPSCALDVAATEFGKLGCLPFCDADNVEAVTRRVNGGYTGLSSRKMWLAHWKAELGHEGAVAPATPPHQIPRVEIPRGSDEHLPPAPTPIAEDKSAWAGLLALFSAGASSLSGAVDALKPIFTDPRTLAIAGGVIAALLLYDYLKRRSAAHV